MSSALGSRAGARPRSKAQRSGCGPATGTRAGRGYYDYSRDPYRRQGSPRRRARRAARRLVVILGESQLAHELREGAAQAGYEVSSERAAPGELAGLTVECEPQSRAGFGGHPSCPRCVVGRRPQPSRWLSAERRRRRPAVQAGRGAPGAAAPAAARAASPAAAAALRAGIAGGGSTRRGRRCGLPSCSPPSSDAQDRRADPQRAFIARRRWRARSASSRRSASTSHGWGTPLGLVLGRILCQLVNEAAFALGEGVGDPDIDTGMTLGLNHPRGPLGWADEVGLDVVLGNARGAARGVRRGALSRRAAAAPGGCAKGGSGERRGRASSSTPRAAEREARRAAAQRGSATGGANLTLGRAGAFYRYEQTTAALSALRR